MSHVSVNMMSQTMLLIVVVVIVTWSRESQCLRLDDVIDKRFERKQEGRGHVSSDSFRSDAPLRDNQDFVRSVLDELRVRDVAYPLDYGEDDDSVLPSSSFSSYSSSSGFRRGKDENAVVRRTGPPSGKSRRGDVSVIHLAELLNTLKSRGTDDGGLPPFRVSDLDR